MPELIAAAGFFLTCILLSIHIFIAADRKFTRDIAAMDAHLGLPPEFQWKGGRKQ